MIFLSDLLIHWIRTNYQLLPLQMGVTDHFHCSIFRKDLFIVGNSIGFLSIEYFYLLEPVHNGSNSFV